MAVELGWFGVEDVGLVARPRTLATDVPGVAALLAAPVVEAVEDVDVAAGVVIVVDVLALVEGSLSSSFEGVEALESLSLPLELAPSDFLALGVAPNGMRLANMRRTKEI